MGAVLATAASSYFLNNYQNITEKSLERTQELFQENNNYIQTINENVLVPKEALENDTLLLYKKIDGFEYKKVN